MKLENDGESVKGKRKKKTEKQENGKGSNDVLNGFRARVCEE